MALKQSVGDFLMSNQSKPVYLKLRDMIAAAIIDGRYAEGEMLPSVRALASEQGANPLTVAKAYQRARSLLARRVARDTRPHGPARGFRTRIAGRGLTEPDLRL